MFKKWQRKNVSFFQNYLFIKNTNQGNFKFISKILVLTTLKKMCITGKPKIRNYNFRVNLMWYTKLADLYKN